MNTISLVMLFPMISFFCLFFLKNFLSYTVSVIISLSSILLSMITVFFLGYFFLKGQNQIIENMVWILWDIKDFTVDICFLIDNLTFVFLVMIICVAFLVCVFSVWYMRFKNDNIMFFALISLFIVNMLVLVLSNNFIIMYIGWEGISICSYLLINFYYFKSYVNTAAITSFLFTKIGDLFLIIGIILLYIHYHSVNFYEIDFLTKVYLIKSNSLLLCINALLLIGAIGKSAQVPLQIWLPEAMVGPAPVSALIHAATMVTAGIYLIVRNHSLFILTPNILYIIGIIGSITLLFSSLVALVECDIKRILAYSTMSQIGYMFIAISVGAWNAAIVHLIVHAMFKALLFLSAGILIMKCHNEQNIYFMGNKLYKIFPFVYYCFLIGGAALSGFPILTLGFYSKDEILFCIYNYHNIFFFITAILSVFCTTFYIFRLIFITFHTQNKGKNIDVSINFFQYFPLSVFAIFSTYFGKYIIPNLCGMFPLIIMLHNYDKVYLEILSSLFVIFSIGVAYYLYILNVNLISTTFTIKILHDLLCIIKNTNFGFSCIYSLLFTNLYLRIAYFLSKKPFNIFNNFILLFIQKIYFLLSYTVNTSFNFCIMIIVYYLISVILFIVLL
ncbi:NADH-quinone oxidoreductase subunit L [Buchnera aphidicola (Takecallis arundicolens)]|uniref:NADH-quinone oxidoreductase subunit L n=1 Tax=Buchnera aphidicola TaxID=9 RepID=UPI003463FF6A